MNLETQELSLKKKKNKQVSDFQTTQEFPHLPSASISNYWLISFPLPRLYRCVPVHLFNSGTNLLFL